MNKEYGKIKKVLNQNNHPVKIVLIILQIKLKL